MYGWYAIQTMYTITQAAKLSGLSVPTMRAWERRYGVVHPERTAAGYRLYSQVSIERLVAMRHLVEHDGIRPSQAAERIRADDTIVASLVEQARTSGGQPQAPAVALSRATEQVEAFVDAAHRLDVPDMERILDEAFASERFEPALEHVVFPALRAVGAAWADGSIDVAMEHAASETVRRRLARFWETMGFEGEADAIVGLPPGSRHEIGAMAFAIAARRGGVRVVYLGADVPVTSWAAAAAASRSSIAVLGVIRPSDVDAATTVALALHALPSRVTVLLGGPAADRVVGAAGTAVLSGSMDDVVGALRSLVPRVA
jgi:MerR family transcriptional regulator, light-induced transcriptional regulator